MTYSLDHRAQRSRAGERRGRKQERVAQSDLQTPPALRELSRLVLAPLQADLRHKRIVVVADGALQYVPFGVLSLTPAAAYRPLIADAEIVSAPSASAVAVQRLTLAERKPAPKGIAIIADPVFSARDGRVRNAAAQPADAPATTETVAVTRILEHFAADAGNRTIPRLPFTADEARQSRLAATSATGRRSAFRPTPTTMIPSG